MARLIVVVSLVTALAAAFAPARAHAQAGSATLSGWIVDKSGAVVPDAKVTILKVATRTERRAATGREGVFTVPALAPGRYVVRAERDGFSPAEASDVVLDVGEQVSLRIQLEVGSVGEFVTVAADTARVRTSPAVATVIGREFVENLPLNGRSFQSLLALVPGVVLTGGGLGQFSVNGQRSNANYFTVDGVGANVGAQVRSGQTIGGAETHQYRMGALPGLTALGGTQALVNLDGLEAFTIQTSTYSAEFGRQPGGQVQLVTRSGTNQFHGSAFGSFRDEAFDANDWFANQAGLPKGKFGQQMFGGTLGGPVVPERTFFFFSYEGLRLLQPATEVTTVPSLRLREEAAPALRPIMHAFPLPDGPELVDADGQPSGLAPLTLRQSNPSSSDTYGLRLDHTLTGGLRLFGRYSWTPSASGTRSLNKLLETAARSRSLTAGVTFASGSRLTNDFRINYADALSHARSSMDDFGGAVPLDISAFTSAYPGTGRRGGGVLILLDDYGTQVGIEQDAAATQRQINVVNTLSWNVGAHGLKFGADLRTLASSDEQNGFNQSSVFLTQASIRSGISGETAVMSGGTVRPRVWNLSLFAQDTWKAGSRLTLDLGVRWDINAPPDEANGIEPILVQGVTGPDDVANAALAPRGTPLYETVWTAFAPRLGAAYQLARTPGRETVLRGGFGFYYDLGNGMTTTGFDVYPFTTYARMTDMPFPMRPDQVVFPPNAQEVSLPLPEDVWSLPIMNPHLKVPYAMEWNVALERSLGASHTVSATYVAAVSRDLLRAQLLNGRAAGVRPNPNFNELLFTTNGPSSDYHALQLQLQRRLSRGIQALANYTWAHAIDEVSSENNSQELDRGNAAMDVRHKMTTALTVDLPAPAARPLRALLGGWSTDATVLVQSGLPFNVTFGAVPQPGGSRLLLRPDLVPGVPLYLDDPTAAGGRRLNPEAFQLVERDPETGEVPRQGTLGRNVLRGLPTWQVDLALRRQITLNSRVRLRLRVEAFNLFNHPNFDRYSGDITSVGLFGTPLGMANQRGGLNSLYQSGGPRSLQFSIKTLF